MSAYNPKLGPQKTSNNVVQPQPSFVYDRNLHRNKIDVSLSSLAFLFMEIVSKHFKASNTLPQVERALNNMGYPIGCKLIQLESLRANFTNSISSSGKSNTSNRLISKIDVLHFITNQIWLSLFGKQADSLEKSTENSDNFMIIDNDPMFTKFISNGIPKEYSSLNCEAFLSGILEGVLDSSYFKCEVSAHSVPIDKFPSKTVYLIKFLS